MVLLRRAQMINLVEHSYFSNIDFRRLGTVLDCFAHDAVLSIGDQDYRDRDGEIKRVLTTLLTAYPLIRHIDLSHDISETEQRIESKFTLRLEDREGVAREGTGDAAFQLLAGKFHRVSVETSAGISLI